MGELKPGMTVWNRKSQRCGILESQHNEAVMVDIGGVSIGVQRADVSPLDPASPAAQALAALERHADDVTVEWNGCGEGWDATLRESVYEAEPALAVVRLVGVGHQQRGEDLRAAAAALRDKLEAAVVAAWEVECRGKV